MTLAEFTRRTVHRLPATAVLWLLWLLLWGSTGPLVLVGGLVVAVVVVTAFPLPSLLPYTPVRPLPLVRLLVHVAVDLVVSATVVAWEAVRHGKRARAAVFEVPLQADDDVLISVTAGLTTLTPGTLVVELDRRRRLLYVHGLPVRDRSAVETRRREGFDAERHVLGSLGSPGAGRAEQRHREEGSA